jgi:hypothetical protein
MMLVLPLAALGACGDAITDPDGLLESAEAEAIVRSAEALPLLPELLDMVPDAGPRQRATLQRARELWDAGTAGENQRAAARRRLAVGYALPLLLAAVPPEEWTASRERIDEWLDTVSSMMQHLSLPLVEARIEAARHQLSRADAAVSDRSRAYHLLLASSELVETTPRYVARTMALDAERAVHRASEATADPLPAATLRRAERLKDWSAAAVEEGEYLLAIQRAYYAIQLVEER